jgi:cytochrome P450
MQEVDELTARLADPRFFLTPEFTRLLGWMRDNSPVHWCQPWPHRGFWAVTRYQDIRAVTDKPVLFSNEAAGNIIPADPDLHRQDRDAMGFGAMTANTDPPKHGELRRIFSQYFSAPRISQLEGGCQAIVDEIFAEVRGRDEFDFISDAAAMLPARLICQLLGVPREDWAEIGRYTNSFASFADPELQLGATPGETFKIAMDFTFDYIARLSERRRADPKDDLISMAAGSLVNGEPILARDAAWSSWSVLAAGFETSRNAISGGLHVLLQHPDQLERLKAEPKLWRSTTEEILRWTVPATALLRVAQEDTEVAGQPVAKGDWVVLFIESANRDERVFADPFRFDIERKPNLHMSFGSGIHACLGRVLATMEVRVMLRTLFERSRGIEIVGPLERIASTIAKGLKHMPVRVAWN